MSKLTIYEKLQEMGNLDRIIISQNILKSKSLYIPKGLSKIDPKKYQRKHREYLKNCCPKKYQKLLERGRKNCKKYIQNLDETRKAKMNERKRLLKGSCYNQQLETKRKYREKNR